MSFKHIINESFINPVIDFLPLIAFVVIDNFWGLKLASFVSVPIILVLMIYYFFSHQQIFNWHAISSFAILSVGFIAAVISDYNNESLFRPIISESVSIVFLLFLVIFHIPIKKQLLKMTKNLIPMENNLDEFFRVANLFLLAFAIRVILFLFIMTAGQKNTSIYTLYINYSYLVLFAFIILYESIRVYFIRYKLLNEEWWPIVDKQGNVVGSIARSASLLNAKKYLHPIIRVLLIRDNMILLKKRKENDIIFPSLWDTAVSNHLQYGESVEKCIHRTLSYSFGIEHINTNFLSNYNHETHNEIHVAFLFYAVYEADVQPNLMYMDAAKWWTIEQIESNLQTGIFSENFEKEFAYLLQNKIIGN